MGSELLTVRTATVLLVAGVAAGCGTYNYNRAALVPHAAPRLHSGAPLDSRGEISVGASSVAHLGKPGVGDPDAGVEIPGTQLHGDARVAVRGLSFGLIYENGLDAGAHPLKSTQPPVDGGSVSGYGFTLDYSVPTGNPRLWVGLGLDAIVWDVPFVEYYSCAATETCFPYSIQTAGRDLVGTFAASLTPTYRLDGVDVFGGVTARQHPTIQQKGMETDPLFQEPEVEAGSFNFILSAGAEVALAHGAVKASAIAYWDVSRSPAKYGPGLAVLVSIPLGRGANAPRPPAPAPVYPPAYAPSPYPPAPYPPAPTYPPPPAAMPAPMPEPAPEPAPTPAP